MRQAKYKINVIMEAPLPGRMRQKTLIEAAKKTMEAEAVPAGSGVNILVAGDRAIRKLNKQFLGRSRATDVIAFTTAGDLIGEVAISVDTARDNARRFSTTSDKELVLYVIHGILHLLGYDDENRQKRAVMEKRQRLILDKICR